MITLSKPIAQEQKNISSSPLFEELSDESAASCSGGYYRALPFAVGGQFIVWRAVPAAVANLSTAAHIARVLREEYRTQVDYVGPELR
jgi:hypothetical protein